VSTCRALQLTRTLAKRQVAAPARTGTPSATTSPSRASCPVLVFRPVRVHRQTCSLLLGAPSRDLHSHGLHPTALLPPRRRMHTWCTVNSTSAVLMLTLVTRVTASLHLLPHRARNLQSRTPGVHGSLRYTRCALRTHAPQGGRETRRARSRKKASVRIGSAHKSTRPQRLGVRSDNDVVHLQGGDNDTAGTALRASARWVAAWISASLASLSAARRSSP
jgi:hypothetical protein